MASYFLRGGFMKKSMDFLNTIINFFISLLLVLPILNILYIIPFLGIVGLVNNLNIFEIKSLIFILFCVIVIGLIVLIVSILTFILFKNKNYKINVHIIISSMLFAITFFILSYASYGSDFLSDLLNGIDLTESIFKMIIYLFLGVANTCIAVNYGILGIGQLIIKTITKSDVN